MSVIMSLPDSLVPTCLVAAVLAVSLLTAARAGDAAKPDAAAPSPEQARCQAMGPDYFAVKGSTACMRVSGYISAGVGFLQPTGADRGPFAPHAATVAGTEVGVGVEARFDTELGPGRLYVEVRDRNVDWGR